MEQKGTAINPYFETEKLKNQVRFTEVAEIKFEYNLYSGGIQK